MKKQLLLTRMLLLVALLVGSVSAWATDYVPVTSTSQLVAGKNYIIVGRYKTAKMDSPTWHSLGTWASDIYGSTSITVSGDLNGSNSIEDVIVTNLGTSHIITLGGSTGAWTLYDNSDSKYISYSGSSNKIFQETTAETNNQKWTISLASGGAVTITNKAVSGRSIYANISSSRFACYTSTQSASTTWLFVEASSGPSISASDKNIAFDATSGEFGYTLNNPVTGGVLSATDNVDWITDVTVDAVNSKVAFNTTANTEPTPRVGTITMTYKKDDETLATKEVKITQAKAVVMLNYTLATQVVPGRHYIIVSGTNGAKYAMGGQTTNNRSEVAVTVDDGEISVESDAGVYEFLIEGDMATGYYTIYDTENSGYLYAASSSNNYLKVQTTNNNNGKWTISIDNTGSATIKAQGDYTHNWMRYNSTSSVFSCYGSGQNDIYLFERDGDTNVQNVDVTINAACNDGGVNYYGTYSNEFAFVVPEGLTVSEIGIVDGKLYVEDYATGAVVPAGTGVMVSSTTDGAHSVTLSVGGTSVLGGDNCLKASGGAGIEAAAMAAASAEGTKFYRLTMHGGTELGFYYGAADGAAFALAANKAYLAVPAASATKEGFSFISGEEETDGIKAVSTTVENGVRYNLAGQKVGADYKGIIVVNGKKYLNK